MQPTPLNWSLQIYRLQPADIKWSQNPPVSVLSCICQLRWLNLQSRGNPVFVSINSVNVIARAENTLLFESS